MENECYRVDWWFETGRRVECYGGRAWEGEKMGSVELEWWLLLQIWRPWQGQLLLQTPYSSLWFAFEGCLSKMKKWFVNSFLPACLNAWQPIIHYSHFSSTEIKYCKNGYFIKPLQINQNYLKTNLHHFIGNIPKLIKMFSLYFFHKKKKNKTKHVNIFLKFMLKILIKAKNN